MNTKRLFAAFIAAFIFAFLFEWLLHGVMLKGSEAALPQGLARTPADFQNHFLWVVLGEAIMIFIFTMIYARGFAADGRLKEKALQIKLMPLLWQKNGTKTQPRKIRSNYRLDNSSRARLFVCACRHGLIREEPRRGS
jgi:F0F1-type ATP synthase membrane subunit c/vacuolar-type H+-ATPase subunit K